MYQRTHQHVCRWNQRRITVVPLRPRFPKWKRSTRSRLIDRQTHWQGDVPKPLVRNFRDERGRNFGGLSEIEQRPISFFDEPLQPSGGRAPPPASFRSTATKRVSPGPMLAEFEGSATGVGAAAGAATLVEVELSRLAPGLLREGSLSFASATGGVGGVKAGVGDAPDRVTSPGRSRGGR